jgi:CBS domain-containing protein
MISKAVKEFMIPVSEYPSVTENATMKDAIMALKKANEAKGDKENPFRAVLVVDKKRHVVGKVGQIAFLKALEPKYRQFFDKEKLTHASSRFLETLMDNYDLWGTDNGDICEIAEKTYVKEIMKPIDEHIDENEGLAAAAHKIIMWNTLSLLVTHGKEIVGIIRVSDIYSELESIISKECNNK